MQHIPDKYTAGELSIRYQGDDSTSETGASYRLNRDYQFVYFGNSELDCIRKASVLQRKIKQADKLRIKDSEDYMTLGSFSFSQPFKTESAEIYAVIGILQAEVREAREFATVEKMREINASIND